MASRLGSKPQSILITGASSRIGLATAQFFQEKGWQVAATMRDPSKNLLSLNRQNLEVFPLDVTDYSSITSAVEGTLKAFGKIDVLFNNAGYGLNGPFEGATDEQMQRQFDVNVFGVVRVMRAVLPHMRRQKRGLIITTSSIGGLIGMPVSPLYISSKHAVEGLIESARFELKPFGIRMKLIEPGGIRTDFARRSADWTSHPSYLEYVEGAKKMSNSLLDGSPDPSEVAKVVYRAADDRSGRLRYLAKPGPYVALYNLLPDFVWRRLIEGALRGQARRSSPASSAKGFTEAVR